MLSEFYSTKMESETTCAGDASATCNIPTATKSTEFTNVDRMRFTSLTYEIMEELRMRRDLDVENERKIQKLLNDRFTLGWRLEQVQNEINSVKQQHTTDLRDYKRQMEDRVREYKTESSQSQMYKKLMEKEKDGLKEENRKLQLANYSLEKKVRETEMQEKLQANEREQHLQQISVFESQYKVLLEEVKKLTETQAVLDKSFNGVHSLQKKLMYDNNHYKCIVQMKDEEIVRLREELLTSNIKNKIEPQTVAEREKKLRAEIVQQKQKIKELEDQNECLKSDKDDFKQKYWKALKQLEEAHKLVKIHLHTAADYRDESQQLLAEKTACAQKLSDTELQLKDLQKEVADLKIVQQEDRKMWLAKEETYAEKVEELKIELENKVQVIVEGDELLRKKGEENSKVMLELESAKAILNVEKMDVVSQTTLQMLSTTDTQTQVTVCVRSKETQVEIMVTNQSSQTINPAIVSSDTQTDVVDCKTVGEQTELAQSRDNYVQTNELIVKSCHTQTDLFSNGPVDGDIQCGIDSIEDKNTSVYEKNQTSQNPRAQQSQEAMMMKEVFPTVNPSPRAEPLPETVAMNDDYPYLNQSCNDNVTDKRDTDGPTLPETIDRNKIAVMYTGEKSDVQFLNSSCKSKNGMEDVDYVCVVSDDVENTYVGIPVSSHNRQDTHTGMPLLSQNTQESLIGISKLSYNMQDTNVGKSATSHNTQDTNVGTSSSAYSIQDFNVGISSQTHNIQDINIGLSATSHNTQDTNVGTSSSAHNTQDFNVGISSQTHNIQDITVGISAISHNTQGTAFGISVPKLDLHREMLTSEQVVVDPDEFNVSLTQEEQCKDKTVNKWQADNDSRKDISTYEAQRSHFSFRNPVGTIPSTPLSSDNKLTEKEHHLSNKNRPHKHKLSSEEVENYFHEFEQTERQFRAVKHGIPSPVCSKSKLPRTSNVVYGDSYGTEMHDTEMRLRDDIRIGPDYTGKVDWSEIELTGKTRKTDRDQVEFEHVDPLTSIGRPEFVLTEEQDGEGGRHNKSNHGKNIGIAEITENPKIPSKVIECTEELHTSTVTVKTAESLKTDSRAVGFRKEPRTSNVNIRESPATGGRAIGFTRKSDTIESPKTDNTANGFTKEPKGLPRRSTSPYSAFPTPVMKASDIMQRYKETVAKVRPMQVQTRQSKPGQNTDNIDGNRQLVTSASSRERTPKGILKDTKEERSSRSQRVSWNELVENKQMD